MRLVTLDMGDCLDKLIAECIGKIIGFNVSALVLERTTNNSKQVETSHPVTFCMSIAYVVRALTSAFVVLARTEISKNKILHLFIHFQCAFFETCLSPRALALLWSTEHSAVTLLSNIADTNGCQDLNDIECTVQNQNRSNSA